MGVLGLGLGSCCELEISRQLHYLGPRSARGECTFFWTEYRLFVFYLHTKIFFTKASMHMWTLEFIKHIPTLQIVKVKLDR